MLQWSWQAPPDVTVDLRPQSILLYSHCLVPVAWVLPVCGMNTFDHVLFSVIGPCIHLKG
jgi:hypothetical protein